MGENRKFHKGFESRFQVYRVANQAIPNMVWTRIQWNMVGYDPLNEYDEAVLYQFTPIRSGFYLIKGAVRYANLIAGNQLGVSINSTVGGIEAAANGENFVGTAVSIHICKLLYVANVNDVWIETWHNGGAGINMLGNLDYSIFEGFRIQ